MSLAQEEQDRIQKRVNKILETRLETDKDTLDALNGLSSFFTENTLQNRRNLRSQIEQRSVAINENFLKAFRQVKIALDEVCEDLDTMASSVDTMRSDLESSKALTKDLIEQTNKMQQQREQLEVHQQIAQAFLARFQLNVPEHQLLYGTAKDAPIVPEFFKVLDRVQSIHSDCRLLMQCGYQTAALDIMEEMTLHQEGALERLYRWTQNHCRNLENNEIGPLIVEAMSRLQDRPVLFKYVIDEYAIARRAVLVRQFIEALTEGGTGGNPKPIELHAHDPKRYIGDMFAWLHQSIPNEKENLTMLFKKCDKHGEWGRRRKRRLLSIYVRFPLIPSRINRKLLSLFSLIYSLLILPRHLGANAEGAELHCRWRLSSVEGARRDHTQLGAGHHHPLYHLQLAALLSADYAPSGAGRQPGAVPH